MKKYFVLILLLLPIFLYASFSISFGESVPGMMQTLFVPIDLQDTSFELLVYPPLENMRFGKIYVANSYFNVLIGSMNGKEVVIVDSNRNKNFTDDYVSNRIISYEENSPIFLSKLFSRSKGSENTYYIIIKKCNGVWGFFGITRKEGILTINNKKYKIFIAETNSDGLFDPDNLIAGVDLNSDGIYESYEIFNKYIQIEGQNYKITDIDVDGKSLTLEETDEKIINTLVGSIVSESIAYKNGEFVFKKGKWKILISGTLNDRMKDLLSYLNNLNSENIDIQYLYLYGKSCCDGNYNDMFKNMESTYPNIKIIPINMENDFDEIYQKLKILLPIDFMIISPENVLIYSTQVSLNEDNLIWDIINPSFIDESNNIKTFIENIIMH
ncbi:MAG: hypothetical protein B6I29_00345 [Marinitoga sp. 4572_148]|nr:MAG: hypothetical protein B6I29_00345 [Marinitoga sp. 4572_148]